MSTDLEVKQKTGIQQLSELQAKLTVFLAPVTSMKVDSIEESQAANVFFKGIREWSRSIDAKLKEINAPHKAEMEKNKAYVEQLMAPLIAAENNIKAQNIAFEKKLEIQREALRRQEQEEHRKREEEARLKIKAAQEEAAAKARAIMEDAEAEAMFMSADDALELQAKANEEQVAAQAKADAESARIAFETQQQHWDTRKEIKAVKVDGARRTWVFKITDEKLIPDNFWLRVLDEKQIKAMMSARKKEIEAGTYKIPGIVFEQELSMTSR
jgi:hypothetical protein